MTGTPVQNNLLEYYAMCEYFRSGGLGRNGGTKKKFTEFFSSVIQAGMTTNATLTNSLRSLYTAGSV